MKQVFQMFNSMDKQERKLFVSESAFITLLLTIVYVTMLIIAR